jgi:hypothetical protein
VFISFVKLGKERRDFLIDLNNATLKIVRHKHYIFKGKDTLIKSIVHSLQSF